jgi:hypothetical protein
MTRTHFEEWATIFQPPDEEELALFDKPAVDAWFHQAITRVGADRRSRLTSDTTHPIHST